MSCLYFHISGQIQHTEILPNQGNTIYKDNTALPRRRGDYAVPTLFNGNFDAIAFKKDDHSIPGWYFYNDNSNINRLTQTYLEDVTRIYGTIKYPNNIPNYALKLGGNQKQAVHNAFLMPDWGNLRFDVFSPINSRETGTLNVRLETITGELITEEVINLEPALPQLSYSDNITRLGIGNGSAFETFQLNLQGEGEEYNRIKENRGKPVILKFSLEGNRNVLLDNVFFKSEPLKWGNPTEARWDSNSPGENNPYTNNLLIEKPQYTASYNAVTKIPNWVSWQLNRFWISPLSRPNTSFISDPELPNSWPKINGNSPNSAGFDAGHLISSQDRSRHQKDSVATFLSSNLIPQSVDNNRFFGETGNEPIRNNSAWYNIERMSRELLDQQANDELYIIAGGVGNKNDKQPELRSSIAKQERFTVIKNEQGQLVRKVTNPEILQAQGIYIPQFSWKSIIVLNKRGGSESDITDTYTFLTPNQPEPYSIDPNQDPMPIERTWPTPVTHPFNSTTINGQTVSSILGINPAPISNSAQWRAPETWQITFEQLQKLLQQVVNPNFNLFSQISESTRDSLKKTKSQLPPAYQYQPPTGF